MNVINKNPLNIKITILPLTKLHDETELLQKQGQCCLHQFRWSWGFASFLSHNFIRVYSYNLQSIFCHNVKFTVPMNFHANVHISGHTFSMCQCLYSLNIHPQHVIVKLCIHSMCECALWHFSAVTHTTKQAEKLSNTQQKQRCYVVTKAKITTTLVTVFLNELFAHNNRSTPSYKIMQDIHVHSSFVFLTR